MSLNTIAKGIALNHAYNLVISFFLVFFRFEIDEMFFTFVLIANVFLVSFFVSRKSPNYQEMNGLFIGLFSSIILILFIWQFVGLYWELNAFIIMTWTLFGLGGGWLGKHTFKAKKAVSREVLILE